MKVSNNKFLNKTTSFSCRLIYGSAILGIFFFNATGVSHEASAWDVPQEIQESTFPTLHVWPSEMWAFLAFLGSERHLKFQVCKNSCFQRILSATLSTLRVTCEAQHPEIPIIKPPGMPPCAIPKSKVSNMLPPTSWGWGGILHRTKLLSCTIRHFRNTCIYIYIYSNECIYIYVCKII